MFWSLPSQKRDMDAEELRCLIRMLTLSQNLVPLICFHEKVTSNQQLLEQMVLKPTVDYLPSPADFKTVQVSNGASSLQHDVLCIDNHN